MKNHVEIRFAFTGFTLVEMMAVIAVLLLLVAIAIPDSPACVAFAPTTRSRSSSDRYGRQDLPGDFSSRPTVRASHPTACR